MSVANGAEGRHYTIPELVQLGLSSDSTVRRWLKEGRLPERRDSRGRYVFTLVEIQNAKDRGRPPARVDRSDAEAWGRSRAAEAPPMSADLAEAAIEAFGEMLRGGAAA